MKSKLDDMEEILDFCMTHKEFTVLEIASALDLDLFFTLYVVDELINQGLID